MSKDDLIEAGWRCRVIIAEGGNIPIRALWRDPEGGSLHSLEDAKEVQHFRAKHTDDVVE